MAEVQLHGKYGNGRVALVDDADLPLVAGHRWLACKDGPKADGTVKWRAWCRLSKCRHPHRYVFMHQLLTGQMWADHKNGDGLDNRRTNLRTATPAQNLVNKAKKPGCTSRYIGVSWSSRRKRWVASIGSWQSGGQIVLGRFQGEDEAAWVRDKAALARYGEFARLNFPLTTFHNRRMSEMATFSQWLGTHEDGPQDDPVAWLARQWKALEGNRPRVSSPSGIEKHLMTLAAGEPAQQDQWTGYVHTAVADATGRYKQAKAAEQSGSSTSSSETQETLPGTAPGYPADDPGMNPVTGKPVAVVPSSQWVQHPDASQFGSCAQEGWARGLAMIGGKTVISCAAGHIFEPEKPGNQAEVQAVQDAAQPVGKPPEGDLVHPDSPAGQALAEAGADPDAQVWEAIDGPDDGPLDLLSLVNLKLTMICLSLGLPTDPAQMVGVIEAAVSELDTSDTLAGQLAQAGMRAAAGEPRAIPAEPGSQASGQPVQPWNGQAMPPDFAAWYGVADPNATEQ